MPAEAGVKGPEPAVAVDGVAGIPGTSGCGALVKAAGPAHVAPSGPKAVNTTVPVGPAAPTTPVTVTVSATGLPSGAPGVAVVVTAAEPCVTTDASSGSLQAVSSGPYVASPL